MALINCSECNKEISDKAVSCPNCGCPISSIDMHSISYDVDEVQKIIQQCGDSKIQAIKIYREKTGLSLKEAKDIVDIEYQKQVDIKRPNIDSDVISKTKHSDNRRISKKPILVIGIIAILVCAIIFIPKITSHFQYINAAKDSVALVMTNGYAQSLFKKIEFSKDIFAERFDINGYRILKQEQTGANYDIIIYDVTIYSDNEPISDDAINNVYEAITSAIDKNFDDNYNFFLKSSRVLFPHIDLTIKTPTDNYTKKYDVSYYFNSTNNSISSDDKITYMTIAQKEVKNVLKSPSSAKFPWSVDEYSITKSGNNVTISGYVDADNSFGANIRTNFTVEIEVSGDKYTLTNITTD